MREQQQPRRAGGDREQRHARPEHPLFDAERVAPAHYLSPTSRDRYAWYLRP